MKKPDTSNLPIAFKSTERALIQAAATSVGKRESTFIREVSLAAARAQLHEPGKQESDS